MIFNDSQRRILVNALKLVIPEDLKCPLCGGVLMKLELTKTTFCETFGCNYGEEK